MAINREGYELLCWARARTQDSWQKTLTLGRQGVILPQWELKAWESTAPRKVDLEGFVTRVDDASAGEELLQQLGCVGVDSMDTSDYEGANVIHNLNEPIPDHLAMSYDAVFDGGTMEHVFDYPKALANAMRMVRPGGWFLAATPSNMWCGHGFYQLGPEIFRMALQPAFGFQLELLAFGLGGFRKDFWVCDRERLDDSSRLSIHSKHPATLLIAAKRVNENAPAEIKVEQSDYTKRWNDAVDNEPQPAENPPSLETANGRRLVGKIAGLMPQSLKERLRWSMARRRNIARLQQGLRRFDHLPS